MNWHQDIAAFISTRALLWGAGVVGAVIVVLLIFHTGVAVGERRAFERIHAGHLPAIGATLGLPHSFIPEGHGVVGTISSILLPTLVVHMRDGEDETIRVGTSTLIRGMATSSDLKIGETIIVIGDPDETAEQIDAGLIRVISQGI